MHVHIQLEFVPPERTEFCFYSSWKIIFFCAGFTTVLPTTREHNNLCVFAWKKSQKYQQFLKHLCSLKKWCRCYDDCWLLRLLLQRQQQLVTDFNTRFHDNDDNIYNNCLQKLLSSVVIYNLTVLPVCCCWNNKNKKKNNEKDVKKY